MAAWQPVAAAVMAWRNLESAPSPARSFRGRLPAAEDRAPPAGEERTVADRAVAHATALVLRLRGQAELTWFGSGGDDDRLGEVPLLRRVHRERRPVEVHRLHVGHH